MRTQAFLLAAALTAGACTGGARPDDEPPMPPAGPVSLSAEAADGGGRLRARATVEETGGALRVRVEAAGLVQGAYGVHLHAVGRCEGPAFTTAGPHWNPTGQQHGKDNPQGMHMGDLPNLLVGTDGRGSFEYTILGAGASIRGGGADALLDEDGAAVVIHERADDFRTDPSGNSGARIACGVLR
jgi:Cu-Zn family superoxide dismutase